MSWGLGWKRPSEIFHLALNYGNEEPAENPGRMSSSSSASSSSSSSVSTMVLQDQELGFRIELDWSAGDDEDQVALRLQSQLMVALPMPQDTVEVDLRPDEASEENVGVEMRVVKRREPLRAVTMSRSAGSGQQSDGAGVLTRLLRSGLAVTDGVSDCGEHWKSVTLLSLCGCGLSVSLTINLFIIIIIILSFTLRCICFGISGNVGFYSYDLI
jgi:hypothetical protein